MGGTTSGKPSICVCPFIDPIVVVSFSNLCTRAVPFTNGGYIDSEFASFYNVFDKLPDPVLRPRLKSTAFPPPHSQPRQGNALEPKMLEHFFRPMGDCFLGAMVSV